MSISEFIKKLLGIGQPLVIANSRLNHPSLIRISRLGPSHLRVLKNVELRSYQF